MPDDDEMRREFEAWARGKIFDITRDEHGEYTSFPTVLIWAGWENGHAAGRRKGLDEAVETCRCRILATKSVDGATEILECVGDIRALMDKEGA